MKPAMRIGGTFARAVVGALLGVLAAGSAHAQLPPGDRAVRLIVPFATGSGTDVAARLLATDLADAIKRPVVVENRPGALATIGTDLAAKAAPDGLTIVATGNTAIAAAPSLLRSMPYDPVTDLAPVALLARAPLALFVGAGAPAKNLAELIAQAKASPGRLSYASGNATGAVAGEMLKQRAGIDLLHVPYKNAPQALTDLAGGVVNLMFNDIAGATPLLKAGRIRPLAITSRERSPVLPDVPSLFESGLAGFELYNWVGIFAPARTPPAAVNYLAEEIARITARPDFRARFARVGLDLVSGGTPDTFATFVRDEIEQWGRMIKASGLQPE